MNINDEQLLLKRSYSLWVIWFFCLGLLFDYMFRVLFGNELLILKHYIFLKGLAFLLINHVLFRPLTLRYWLIYNSTQIRKKPTFLEVMKGSNIGEKLLVSLGCLLWLFVLTLWLFDVPQMPIEEELKKISLAIFITGTCIFWQLKFKL